MRNLRHKRSLCASQGPVADQELVPPYIARHASTVDLPISVPELFHLRAAWQQGFVGGCQKLASHLRVPCVSLPEHARPLLASSDRSLALWPTTWVTWVNPALFATFFLSYT